MKKRRRRRRSPGEIEEILEEYRESAVSQAAFAEERGVAVSTLAYWLRKESTGAVKKSATSRQLVPVRIVDAARAKGSETVEVESAQGYLLRMRPGMTTPAGAGGGGGHPRTHTTHRIGAYRPRSSPAWASRT